MYKSTKRIYQNCEILPKRGKVYKKYNKTLAILDKM